jgi:hypothetical protein
MNTPNDENSKTDSTEAQERAGVVLVALPGSAVFPLGHVLSITTSRLCCDMGGVYEILNHVTGDNLFTHVLPRACRFAAPLILEQHPELAAAGTEAEMQRLTDEIAASKTPMDGIRAWLAGLPLKAEYEIAPHVDKWEAKHPLADLADEIGEDRVKARCVVIDPQNTKATESQPGADMAANKRNELNGN